MLLPYMASNIKWDLKVDVVCRWEVNFLKVNQRMWMEICLGISSVVNVSQTVFLFGIFTFHVRKNVIKWGGIIAFIDQLNDCLIRVFTNGSIFLGKLQPYNRIKLINYYDKHYSSLNKPIHSVKKRILQT